MKKLGFLGPRGTFSDEAAIRYNKDNSLELVPFSSFFDIIDAVDTGSIDFGIVPIENSIEGSIGATLDSLVSSNNVKIIEESDMHIKHNLLARPDTQKSEITDIFSHYQPIGQCIKYIRKNFPTATINKTGSTTVAARQVSETTDKKYGAIGTASAAEIYGLSILEENINDYANTVTRFVIIGTTSTEANTHNKTSIAFTTNADRPGALYEILGVFAKRDINLTKIESRPSKEALGEYYFFIDFVGHTSQNTVKEVLEEIKELVETLKILGSYPVRTNNGEK